MTRYVRSFVRAAEREAVMAWLSELHPLWEQRWSTLRPPPPGETQRPLLRPVWWLGTWQFACLGYYRPPGGTRDRVVRAEPFPAPLRAWVERIGAEIRSSVAPSDVPRGYAPNTCLVNLYGERVVDGRREDRGRVGDHRDHEPGPVASVSLGARTLFQFVDRRGKVAEERWLDDGSLMIFAGARHKEQLFHRVQRVDRKGGPLPPHLDDFVTRRVNFTFRYVPEEHIQTLAQLSPEAGADVAGYVDRLAERSAWWSEARKEARAERSG